jgi:DNA-binding NarL/FixJ family response regulator
MPAATTEPGLPASKAILIVDDHPMLRRGLATLIESESDLVVCGEVASCAAALDAIREHSPDLVMVDLSLDGCDGLDLIKQMKTRNPEIPVLVLSMYDEALYAERALRAGARGYVTKQQLDDTVLVAIRCLLGGEMYLSSKLERQLAAKCLGARTVIAESPLQALSDRELQVFRLIGQGRSTRQIAATLHLSIKTVESHREHIKQKLRLESATELSHRAIRWVETGHTG